MNCLPSTNISFAILTAFGFHSNFGHSAVTKFMKCWTYP